jgi:exodeoxyribonuclease V beta subunit
VSTLGERPFAIDGPLPSGVTVLEASAGTGKTYTIAALAARFVAEGHPLSELLLVTFTRIATGELRERVRERLVTCERELGRVLAGSVPSDPCDAVAALLADGPHDQVRLRRDRLRRALSDFDAATIATTHGFCQEVLHELGTLGDLEPDVVFVEDVAELVEEVIDDLYLRRFWREQAPPISRREAGLIARAAIESPGAPIHPLAGAPDGIPAMRRRLALSARKELERRKRGRALMTHDDLLTRLCATLERPGGEAAAARLRARYRVVLIDEFQDTDPIQWAIVERAFGDGRTALVLIGDPKQAIYAFRGADVYAYLAAVRAAGTRRTLTLNRRSDQNLIDGLDALFGEARLGHPGIAYRRVLAIDGHHGSRLCGAPVAQALRVRVVERTHPAIEMTPGGFASAPSAREHIAQDLAGEVVALLDSEAQIDRRDDRGETIDQAPVAPGDLAVLVRSHRTASLIRDQLEAAGVPAVAGGSGSVFASDAAKQWLAVLEALERPSSRFRARAAALTSLLGWSVAELAMVDEPALEELHQRLHHWARILRERGMAALSDTIAAGTRLPARLLAVRGGERLLTDLEHVAESLHAAADAEGLGAAALAGWLRTRIRASEREGADDERARRLESDAEAVQVLTIHRSKGLEFPIVFCPFLWEPGPISGDGEPVYFHDPECEERRAVDVGLNGPEYAEHRARHVLEERGEDLRLAYVAMTRARHQVILWWAGSRASRNAPLTRLLLGQDGAGNVALALGGTPADSAVLDQLRGIAERAPHAVSVELARPRALTRWDPPTGRPENLGVARFERELDLLWRRTSYSAITAVAHQELLGSDRVRSEPEERVVQDEPAGPTSAGETGETGEARGDPAPAGKTGGQPLPLAEMALGPRIGTIVHRTLEAVDFAAADLEAAVLDQLRAAAGADAGTAAQQVLGGDPERIASGLALALETPLGGELGGLSLRGIQRRDRLDELAFELPLAGGEDPTGQLGLDSVAAVLRRHLPAGDQFADYAERLGEPSLTGVLRGYLTGSIDLLLRIPRPGGGSGFMLVDYKTNWLAGPEVELRAEHYRPAALIAEMQRAHYVLQAILYAVAAHRFLRWRVASYDPATDLLGVRYLFLRGMLGAARPGGVLAWRPPPQLVEELSDVLDGRNVLARRAER